MVGHLVIPTRIEIGTQTEVLVHSEPGVGGCVLGHEPDPSELRRSSAGRHRAPQSNRSRSEETDAQMQQGGLPCTVRSDQPDDLPFGMDRVQSERAQRRPYRLPRLEAPVRRSCHTFGEAVAERSAVDGLDVVGTSPAERAETNHLAMEARNLA